MIRAGHPFPLCRAAWQPRWRRSLRERAALTLLLCLAPLSTGGAQADGERAWQAGQQAALRGMADSALRAYDEALRLARQDGDQELASAARLGQAEVWDVWRKCADSARAAYQDAVLLTSEGDYAAADAFVMWLARRGDQAGARALHMRTYEPIENDVPRTITRESVNFLLALASIQIANASRSGAMASLSSARSIAARLATGDEGSANGTVRPGNYWVLHDIAQLQLDAASRAPVRNVSQGRALLRELDAATNVSDNGGHPRFTVGRLADRVARTRRTCNAAECRLPPPPTSSTCRR